MLNPIFFKITGTMLDPILFKITETMLILFSLK